MIDSSHYFEEGMEAGPKRIWRAGQYVAPDTIRAWTYQDIVLEMARFIKLNPNCTLKELLANFTPEERPAVIETFQKYQEKRR